MQVERLLERMNTQDWVKGTLASNLSPSHHLIFLVERDYVEMELEFDCSPQIQKDSQMKEMLQRKDDMLCEFFQS